MISLGIDSGTQSTKTIALDVETGEILASATAAYGLIEDLPPGHLEQDPQTWIDAVDSTIRECLNKLGTRRDDVKAIGVSGQQHGFVPLDKKGKVIRPAKLWCDTSTVAQCKQFDDEFDGPEGLIKLSGNAVLPGYTAPKSSGCFRTSRRITRRSRRCCCRTITSISTSPVSAGWSLATHPDRAHGCAREEMVRAARGIHRSGSARLPAADLQLAPGARAAS
jgi:ribulose kinase